MKTSFATAPNLQNDPNFKDLFDENAEKRERFLKPNKIGDVELRVLEMVGSAGDVYLMDMRVLHAPALNTLKKARLMATNRYLRTD
ncbi:MAG: hypothetical protein ACOH5I_13295 [Oligoflexus sp.]